MAFKKCDGQPFPPAVVTGIVVVSVLGLGKSFGIFGVSVMTKSPADICGGSSFKQGKGPFSSPLGCGHLSLPRHGAVGMGGRDLDSELP